MTTTQQQPPAPVLVVENVSKSYGPRKALDQVSLSVAAGEFVALLGPNGAGKTTLFQLLSGLFVADGGTIRVLDDDLANSPVRALAGLGIVFQQPTLDLDLSVLANLRFHTRLHGMSAALANVRINDALHRLGLSDRAKDLVRGLSGGNRRKVELARALVHRPAALLMDEATVGLDPASRKQLVDYVLSLCQDPPAEENAAAVGVLWATHLVDEAERADRVVVLHHGKVLREGTPQALVEATGAADLAAAFLQLTDTATSAAKEPAG